MCRSAPPPRHAHFSFPSLSLCAWYAFFTTLKLRKMTVLSNKVDSQVTEFQNVEKNPRKCLII
jgi:hypothetical protein